MSVGLGLILAAVLVGPVFVGSIERNIEVFFLVAGTLGLLVIWLIFFTAFVIGALVTRVLSARARALPGVYAVLTGHDFPPGKFGILPVSQDEEPLCRARVRMVGDELRDSCSPILVVMTFQFLPF